MEYHLEYYWLLIIYILTSLYDKQNQKIKESVNNNIQQYENYIIDSYPTLFDLAEALKKYQRMLLTQLEPMRLSIIMKFY